MSKIRDLISTVSLQNAAGAFDSVENSLLVTTDRLLIFNDSINLPRKAFGDCIFNYALIFSDFNSNVIFAEATCSVDQEGMIVNFDSEDNLDGKYAVVSYLGKNNE